MGSESLAHEANNTKQNFLGQPEKMIFKFHKMTSYTVYIWNFQNFICGFTNSCEIWLQKFIKFLAFAKYLTLPLIIIISLTLPPPRVSTRPAPEITVRSCCSWGKM